MGVGSPVAAGQAAGVSRRAWAVHWPAQVAAIVAALLFALLPDRLRIGPRYALPAVVIGAVLLLTLLKWRQLHVTTRRVGFALAAVLTAAVVSSAASLVSRLPGGRVAPRDLLFDGGLVWGFNVLTFALWYWELDAGGPRRRHLAPYEPTDLLFPQVQRADSGPLGWKPAFVDYLFLAFNTSTAFSPTDTLILSRVMKVLMMCQSLISLVVVSVLIARAINAFQ